MAAIATVALASSCRDAERSDAARNANTSPAAVTIRGRIAPEDLRALGPREFVLHPNIVDGTWLAVPVRLDVREDGSFTTSISCVDPLRVFGIGRVEAWPIDGTWPPFTQLPSQSFSLRSGGKDTIELPELRVQTPESRTGLDTLSEDELEARWYTLFGDVVRSKPRSHAKDSLALSLNDPLKNTFGGGWECLPIEAARRGGPIWTERLVELARASLDGDHPNARLVALTALRRSEGLPAPVSIEVLPTSTTVVTFPESPMLRVRRTNRDAHGFAVRVSTDVEDRWLVTVRDSKGTPAPCTIQGLLGRVGTPAVFGQHFLGSGDFVEDVVDVRRSCSPVPLGVTTARVFLTETVEHWSFVDGRGPHAFLWSEPFTLEVRPREVHVSLERRRELEDALARLETTGPYPLSSERLAWIERWRTPAHTPTEELLQGGMAAVGILLEHLDEPGRDVERQVRVLALLSSLTGLLREDVISYMGSLFGPDTIKVTRHDNGPAELSWKPDAAPPQFQLPGGPDDLARHWTPAWRAFREGVVCRTP